MIRLRHLLTATLLLCLAFAKAQEVTFSTPGGFYDNPFELALSCSQWDKVIHYTTNGNTPTVNDPVYTVPLLMDERLFSHSNIYTIPNCPDALWFQPESVQKCIVIRAAAFDEAGNCIGKVTTNTYLIKSLGCDSHGLPVLSLCADSLALFDYETGILVPGINYDPTADDPSNTGNYHQHGIEWERLAHVDFIEPDSKACINQDCGLRTHGNRARSALAKGLKIYAREEYGKKHFKHRFFNTEDNNKYKRLVLKPFSTLWPYAGVQDHICVQMADRLHLDTQQSRPMILFLNGEYWGVYFLQEKLDERYLEQHYGIDPDSCNIIENWHTEAENGDASDYVQLKNWLADNDLSVQQNYDELCQHIDVENYTDYFLLETFAANTDWPANNTRFWQEIDGKWKWMFYDGDATLTDSLFDVFGNATYTGDAGWPSSTKATLLFRKLLENEGFRQRLLQRCEELCNSVFSYNTTALDLQEIRAALMPEIENHSQRFGYPSSLEEWLWGVQIVDNFLKNRATSYSLKLKQFIHQWEHEAYPDRFTCFPNPTSEHVRLILLDSLSEANEVAVYDLSGRLVHKEALPSFSNDPIEIAATLQSGIYIISIGKHVEKLVIY